MLFGFQFLGDTEAAKRIANGDGGFRLHGLSGVWDSDEGLRQGGSHALDVWCQLRMLGETEWEEPDILFKWLKDQHIGPRQILQWIGAESLGRLQGFDPSVYEKDPPVQLSLAVDEGFMPKALHAFQIHPLSAETLDWIHMRPWGRGSGVIVEANPFLEGAEAEVFFLLIRDLARQVPLRADRMGFRLVRAWLPLEACRTIMHQIR